MILIKEEIPAQGFELVREAIGAILKIELTNQFALKSIPLDTKVFIERSAPFQQQEEMIINVLLEGEENRLSSEASSQGNTSYYIDIYTSAKEKAQSSGGHESAALRDKIVGMIKFILSDHHYKTLNFPMGSIMGTYVDGFQNFIPQSNNDSAFVKTSRISFSVRINENQTLWDGIELNTIFTNVKLELTEEGYIFSDI